jgi:hypothetical protein
MVRASGVVTAATSFRLTCATVCVDADTVEHCGRSFACVEAAEFVEGMVDRLLHVGVHGFDDFFWHGLSC